MKTTRWLRALKPQTLWAEEELLGAAALRWIPSLEPETEVEVLVMAYHSYVQVGSRHVT